VVSTLLLLLSCLGICFFVRELRKLLHAPCLPEGARLLEYANL